MSTSSDSSFEVVSALEGSDVKEGSSPDPLFSRTNSDSKSGNVSARRMPIFEFFILFCLFATIAGLIFNSSARLPGDAKFQKEINEIKWARSNLSKITCLKDVPEKLMSKWKPDPSRVIGVDFSKEEDGVNKTIVMTGTPVFEARNDKKVMMKIVAEYEGKIVNSTEFIFNKGCVYISECKILKIYIKDGDLYFSDVYNKQGLVYTIPAKDLF